jgi:hypothetical protein
MLALVLKVIDFLRYAKAADINGVATQAITWIAGVVVLLLVSQTNWADGIPIGDTPLSKLGFWSLVFAGVSLASTASLTKDTLKSVDNANSSAIPTLLDAGPRGRTPTKNGVGMTDAG